MEERVLSKKEKRALVKDEKRKVRVRKSIVDSAKKVLIIILALGFLGWLGYKGYEFVMTPTGEVNTEALALSENDRIKGTKNAPAILIEYGDFECPACAGYSEVVGRLYKEFEGDLAVVYRHFPLIQTHKNAMISSKAAEAAGLQDKFWEMHDLLYQKQDDWAGERDPKDKFVEYAKGLGLDEEKFVNDIKSSQIEEKINADILSANMLKINATPSFFVNGSPVYNPKGYESIKKAIEAALEQN